MKVITVDQIWLGEFAENGLLTDLTNYTQKWGRIPDWYEIYWDAGAYNDRVYAIWAWADVRGMWYWKDLVQKAGVDPNSLKTWDGYIASAKKLNDVPKVLREHILLLLITLLTCPFIHIFGCLEEPLLKIDQDTPTKGHYWFPDYNMDFAANR